ncbi:class I SAM-dependent methyltransferase, partial [Planctomycetota bacterium]
IIAVKMCANVVVSLEKDSNTEQHYKKVLARISQIRQMKKNDTIVEIGAAQGRGLIACAKMGYKAIGIEPWDEARNIGYRLAKHENVKIQLLKGTAEKIPLGSESCELVLANSVIEHVIDAQAAFNEIFRILKPEGVFWFFTASSMCPKQGEISGFPFFGWYPDRIKRKIMYWAKTNKPELIGYTETPAINWFTPRKARLMLAKAHFKRIYDRWDLRTYSEWDSLHKVILWTIKSNGIARSIANMLKSACEYSAVK